MYFDKHCIQLFHDRLNRDVRFIGIYKNQLSNEIFYFRSVKLSCIAYLCDC